MQPRVPLRVRPQRPQSPDLGQRRVPAGQVVAAQAAAEPPQPPARRRRAVTCRSQPPIARSLGIEPVGGERPSSASTRSASRRAAARRPRVGSRAARREPSRAAPARACVPVQRLTRLGEQPARPDLRLAVARGRRARARPAAPPLGPAGGELLPQLHPRRRRDDQVDVVGGAQRLAVDAALGDQPGQLALDQPADRPCRPRTAARISRARRAAGAVRPARRPGSSPGARPGPGAPRQLAEQPLGWRPRGRPTPSASSGRAAAARAGRSSCPPGGAGTSAAAQVRRPARRPRRRPAGVPRRGRHPRSRSASTTLGARRAARPAARPRSRRPAELAVGRQRAAARRPGRPPAPARGELEQRRELAPPSAAAGVPGGTASGMLAVAPRRARAATRPPRPATTVTPSIGYVAASCSAIARSPPQRLAERPARRRRARRRSRVHPGRSASLSSVAARSESSRAASCSCTSWSAERPSTARQSGWISSGSPSRSTRSGSSFWATTRTRLPCAIEVADQVADRVCLAGAGRALHGDVAVLRPAGGRSTPAPRWSASA